MPNYTPETATDITTSPYTTTQDVFPAPTGTDYEPDCNSGDQFHAVWWHFLSGPNAVVFSFRGKSQDYNVLVSVWTGTLGSLTQVTSSDSTFCGNTSADQYYEVPIEANTNYWIQIASYDEVIDDPSNLTLDVVKGPQFAAPAAASIITDDEDGFPGAVVSAVDGSFLRFVRLPAGEFGDQLNAGTLCTENGADTPIPLAVALYTSSLTLISVVNLPAPATQLWGVRGDRILRFYILTADVNGGVRAVRTLSITGTLGTRQVLPANSANAQAFAVKQDGTRLYYGVIDKFSPAFDEPIHVWDLVNQIALSDLIAGYADEELRGVGDGFVTSAGKIGFAFYKPSDGSGRVRLFNSDGSVALTISVLTGALDKVQLNRYAMLPDESGVRVWTYDDALENSVLTDYSLTTGSVIAGPFTVPMMEVSGEPKPDDEPFAVSNSCPLFILTQEATFVDDITVDCDTDALTITGTGFQDDTLVLTGPPDSEAVAFTIVSQTSTEIVVTLDDGFLAGEYCASVNSSETVCIDLTCGVTADAMTGNCDDNNLIVTGTHLDSYSTAVVTNPSDNTVSSTVVSVTATVMIIHVNVPIEAGQYCVTIDALDPVCASLSCAGVTSPICRKIRFPLPFNQDMLMFLYRLEFLIQSGVSPNASITVNLSRDGGYTWPITRTLTAGAISAYDWRVYTTNMGQGRNWVCEFVTEAPYFWALIQVYADMEAGTS